MSKVYEKLVYSSIQMTVSLMGRSCGLEKREGALYKSSRKCLGHCSSLNESLVIICTVVFEELYAT